MNRRETSLVKITRPRVSGIVLRERLFRLIDDGRMRPVLWVSAAAGAGKTTLVASYLDSRQLRCLWYQVDERDSDAASFFYYLGLAAKKAAPRYRTPLPLLTPEYLPELATFAKRYFEAFASRLKPPFLLVFDNYQEMPADALIHEIFQQMASVVPEGIRIVIISRTGPPPPFARLIANNRLLSLTAADLRFSEKESQQLIHENSGENIAPETAGELHARTQGWAAGLVLLLEMAKNSGSGIIGVDRQPPEEIFHYFAGELFDKVDPDTRQFLLKTAFPAALTLNDAESLSGIPQAGRMLAELTRRNFFIVRRQDPEPSYQYHPLFREFLQQQAREEFAADEFAALQRQAAGLLVKAGQLEDAVPLYFAAGDWPGLVPLILGQAPTLVGQGRTRTLLEWIGNLPPEISETEPWLLFWSGVCTLTFNPSASRGMLEKLLPHSRRTRRGERSSDLLVGDRPDLFV